MLWGADLSRLTSSYSECLDLFRHALDFLSNDDNEWILGRAFGRGFELAGIRLPLMPG